MGSFRMERTHTSGPSWTKGPTSQYVFGVLEQWCEDWQLHWEKVANRLIAWVPLTENIWRSSLLSVLSAPIETEHLLGHSICPADVANWDRCPWHLKTRAGRSSVWSICMIWPLLPSHPRCWCTCKSKLVCSWVCAGNKELSRYTCDWTSQGQK